MARGKRHEARRGEGGEGGGEAGGGEQRQEARPGKDDDETLGGEVAPDCGFEEQLFRFRF